MKKCLLGGSASGIAVHNQNTQPLILTQDVLPTEQQCLTIWPTKEGWHKLAWWQNTAIANTQDDHHVLIDTWFYVYGEQDWPVWQQTQKQQASQNMATQHNTQPLNTPSVKSLDKDWFGGLLVLSMSLLWLERKLV